MKAEPKSFVHFVVQFVSGILFNCTQQKLVMQYFSAYKQLHEIGPCFHKRCEKAESDCLAHYAPSTVMEPCTRKMRTREKARGTKESKVMNITYPTVRLHRKEAGKIGVLFICRGFFFYRLFFSLKMEDEGRSCCLLSQHGVTLTFPQFHFLLFCGGFFFCVSFYNVVENLLETCALGKNETISF